jgi:hypothetical protein
MQRHTLIDVLKIEKIQFLNNDLLQSNNLEPFLTILPYSIY